MKSISILILLLLNFNLLNAQNLDTLSIVSPDIYKGEEMAFLRDWASNLYYPQKAFNELKFGTEIISVKIFPNNVEPELEIINSISVHIDKSITKTFKYIQKKFILKNIMDTSIIFLAITYEIRPFTYEKTSISKKIINDIHVTKSSDNINKIISDKELLKQYQTASDSNALIKQLEILDELKRRNPFNKILVEEHLKVSQSLGIENNIKQDIKLLELID